VPKKYDIQCCDKFDQYINTEYAICSLDLKNVIVVMYIFSDFVFLLAPYETLLTLTV
jgi:hypothetical protein